MGGMYSLGRVSISQGPTCRLQAWLPSAGPGGGAGAVGPAGRCQAACGAADVCTGAGEGALAGAADGAGAGKPGVEGTGGGASNAGQSVSAKEDEIGSCRVKSWCHAVRLIRALLPWVHLQQQGEQQQLQQRAEAAEAALEKQRAATAELRTVLDALRWEGDLVATRREWLPCMCTHGRLGYRGIGQRHLSAPGEHRRSYFACVRAHHEQSSTWLAPISLCSLQTQGGGPGKGARIAEATA